MGEKNVLWQSRVGLKQKTLLIGNVFCWHLATVWINIDRERASPSKRQFNNSIKISVKQGVVEKIVKSLKIKN